MIDGFALGRKNGSIKGISDASMLELELGLWDGFDDGLNDGSIDG
jgi:hypothetical protein